MPTRRKGLCVWLVILIGLVFFSGCGKNSQRAIIGKWEGVLVVHGIRRNVCLEFLENGKLTISEVGGTYEFIEKNKIRLNFPGSFHHKLLELEFKILKDKLLLFSEEEKAELQFQRIKDDKQNFKRTIIGKWKGMMYGRNVCLEFLENGKLTIPEVSGTYEFIGKDKIKLEFGLVGSDDEFPDIEECGFKILKDKLLLFSEEEKAELQFQRVK